MAESDRAARVAIVRPTTIWSSGRAGGRLTLDRVAA